MEQYIFVLKEMYKWYRKGLAMLGLEALETSLLVSKLHLNNNKLEKFLRVFDKKSPWHFL